MRDSAFGPADIPPEFWTRPEVTRALARRDIGALFRLLKKWAGLSQNRIGTATSIYQGRVSDIVHDKYHVKSLKKLAEIADGLGMPGPARAALGLAPGPVGQVSTPPLPAGPEAAQRPVAGTQYPATIGQAITAATGLWQADTARSQEVLSAPLDPAAWNGAALAWLLSQPDAKIGRAHV